MRINTVNDALYNYLTIKTIYDARPEDNAAKETYDQFFHILTNDFHISAVDVERDDENECYLVTYQLDEKKGTTRFPIEAIDCFLTQINELEERNK
ncbi:MAG: hypothetical protein ACI35O_05405 [Bacillaceae bacterium]